MTLFYCAHWQTYVSGTLRFGKVDVTEAQCTIMTIHIISAIFGPDIWMTKVRQLVSGKLFVFFCFIRLGFAIFLFQSRSDAASSVCHRHN